MEIKQNAKMIKFYVWMDGPILYHIIASRDLQDFGFKMAQNDMLPPNPHTPPRCAWCGGPVRAHDWVGIQDVVQTIFDDGSRVTFVRRRYWHPNCRRIEINWLAIRFNFAGA